MPLSLPSESLPSILVPRNMKIWLCFHKAQASLLSTVSPIFWIFCVSDLPQLPQETKLNHCIARPWCSRGQKYPPLMYMMCSWWWAMVLDTISYWHNCYMVDCRWSNELVRSRIFLGRCLLNCIEYSMVWGLYALACFYGDNAIPQQFAWQFV